MIDRDHIDDFTPGPENTGDGFGWDFIHYDREVDSCIMQVVPSSTETVVYYPDEDECIALIVDLETMQIVGVQLEGYDPKALR